MSARFQTEWQHGFDSLRDAPIACHELDHEGRVVQVNRAGCRLLGLESAQIVGRFVWEFVIPEEQEATRDSVLRKLAEVVPIDPFERTWVRPDGSRLILEIHSQYLLDDRGGIFRVRSFLLDITRRKQAELALRKVQQNLEHRIKERTMELELTNDFLRREMEERHVAAEEHRKLEKQVQHAQRLESLGVLAGGIAHDFNNLLASIMGYASLAAMDMPEGSRGHRSIEQVLAAAKSAADLTQQMLAYSGRGTFLLEAVNLTKVIESVARLLESTISKKAALQLHLAADLPSIQADSSQIRQVVMNLITNAAESLEDQCGTVQVRTGLFLADEGELPSIVPGEIMPAATYVFLEVADTGCGMDADTINRIFDPFFTTKFTGRGLGLAAVLGIIRSHQGSIRVQSGVGEGTTFRVMFPAVEVPAAIEAETFPEAEQWQSEGTVLVVDDQESIRNLAQMILERSGLTVLKAADGREAIEVFARYARELHAVVLDLNMPGMDGIEVFLRMRELIPDVRVVLCSGYNEQDVTTRLPDHRPAAFLRKPYHPGELVDRLRAIW
jgi:PAS domain S-box-containing protein